MKLAAALEAEAETFALAALAALESAAVMTEAESAALAARPPIRRVRIGQADLESVLESLPRCFTGVRYLAALAAR